MDQQRFTIEDFQTLSNFSDTFNKLGELILPSQQYVEKVLKLKFRKNSETVLQDKRLSFDWKQKTQFISLGISWKSKTPFLYTHIWINIPTLPHSEIKAFLAERKWQDLHSPENRKMLENPIWYHSQHPEIINFYKFKYIFEVLKEESIEDSLHLAINNFFKQAIDDIMHLKQKSRTLFEVSSS